MKAYAVGSWTNDPSVYIGAQSENKRKGVPKNIGDGSYYRKLNWKQNPNARLA